MPPFLIHLSHAFGIIPLNRMNTKSHLLMDYILMLLVPALYVTCYTLIMFQENYAIFMFPSCASTCSFFSKIFIQMGFFLYLSTHGFSLYRRKRFYSVFEKKLKFINDLIANCQQVINYKPKKEARRHQWPIYVLFGSIGLSLTYVIFYDFLQMVGLYDNWFWIPFICCSFPYLAASILQLHFICYVSDILKSFENVNKLFRKIYDDCCELKKESDVLKIYDIDTHVEKNNKNFDNPPALFEKKDATNKVNFHEIGPSKMTSEIILPRLFELHEKILSLCELTNGQYGPQCVPFITCGFIMIILTIFVQTKVIIVVGAKNHYLNYAAVVIGVWTFCIMSIAYMILNYCYRTKGCSKTAAMIVHDIMQKKPAFMLGNVAYYNKMKSFSLQYLHWENYFHFNGIGLFALDYTLIFSAVSAGTSYLIVLLQFDMVPILREDNLI